MTRRHRILIVLSAGVLAAALAGCTDGSGATSPSAPAPTPPSTPTSSPSPSADQSSIDLVRGYLDDIAARDYETAFASLSAAAQAHYVDAAGFEQSAARDESIQPTLLTPAVDLADAEWTAVEAAEGSIEVVTVVVETSPAGTSPVADAWVVRDEDGRAVIDSVGQPSTGPTILSWINPDVGTVADPTPSVYDPSTAVSVSFSAEVPAERSNEMFFIDAGDTPALQVPATDLDGDAAGYLLDAPAFTAGLHHVTLLWQDDARGTDPNAWYTSTVAFEG